MTKKEAIEQMKKGVKITHESFSTNEWMTIERGSLLLEDGVRCPLFEFFKWRRENYWDKGYSIYK